MLPARLLLTALALLGTTTATHALDLPVDPTLGAGRLLLRCQPDANGHWHATLYYQPPRNHPADYHVQGTLANTPVHQDGTAYTTTRLADTTIDTHAPELTQLLEPLHVETHTTHHDTTHQVTIHAHNTGTQPALLRITYLNWTHLHLPDRDLDQHVTLTLNDQPLQPRTLTRHNATYLLADLTRTDHGTYTIPYTRLAPGATLDLTLTITADYNPGKLLITRRLLLDQPPIPLHLQAEIERPTNYRLHDHQLTFWTPAPGVKYRVEYAIKRDQHLEFHTLTGTSDHQGPITINLPNQPLLAHVTLTQPPRLTYEIRDRQRLPLRTTHRTPGVKIAWRTTTDGARITLTGRGTVLLGLLLDGQPTDLHATGASILETGTLPDGRGYALLDAGPVQHERALDVHTPARVLAVLARVLPLTPPTPEGAAG